MPSISSVLNIAKEALLTHQASITVAGHNIANVDTPGYSRQVLNLTTSNATPHRVGFFGNGVVSDSIVRKYDQFMVQRQMDQSSTIKNLETQQQSMRVIETTFNEVPGLAVNDLLSQFWESWQSLSNNPELSSTRQTVIQQAELLNQQINTMSAEITQTKFDLGVSLQSSIDDVNALTKQLADLNVKITSSETPQQQQNDLRDTRDQMLEELAGYIETTFFESTSGAYTIMMADGHSLVDTNEYWTLDWTNNELNWVNTNSLGDQTKAVVGNSADLGGVLGGLIGMNNQLVEGNPDNYLGRLDALANSLIREVNQAHSQGVGTIRFSDQLTSAELAKDATLLHTTVDPLTSTETIAAGTLQINDRSIGRVDGAVNTNGLAMGKSYNAAQAINAAEAGVDARLTTLVGGGSVTGLAALETVSFSVNGASISYTAAGAETAAQTAAAIANAINTAITAYNATPATPPENTPKITIEATVGTGLNGGTANSIILRNSNPGDESRIIIADVDNTDPAEQKLALTDGTYVADASHNTGELSVFSESGPIYIDGGADDKTLAHLGWGGTLTYSNQAAKDAPAGPATAISFDLNGQSIAVSIPGGTLAAATAQLIVDEINLSTNLSGVSAEVGNGTNGGILNSVVFSSDSRDIKIEKYKENAAAVPVGAELAGFNTFTKLGASSADPTSNDGKLTYAYTDNGVAASLMGLSYADNLITDGASFDLWIYNTDGSLALSQPVSVSMERAYTLNDVANTINTSVKNAINDQTIPTPAPWVKATVVANQLVLTPDSSHSFAFGGDNSNFLAAVGLNTLFTGHSASTISLNQTVVKNLDNLAAGQINQFGEIFPGDNSNALLITNIQRDENITFTGGRTDTMDGFYNSLIAEIGLKGRSVNTDLEYNQLVGNQLDEIRDATSGVSLDEEMANLIKYQHAYSAAAKLISTADEMMQTLLASVGR